MRRKMNHYALFRTAHITRRVGTTVRCVFVFIRRTRHARVCALCLCDCVCVRITPDADNKYQFKVLTRECV